MIWKTNLAVVLLCGTAIGSGPEIREPRAFFRDQVGLSDGEISMIARGKAVAKVLPTQTPSEILVFGAVFVNARPERYAKLALDMGRLRRSPHYLGAGRFSDPPLLSDLEGFILEPDDIRGLKNCRPGKCSVQLPAEAIEELRASLDWSRPDVGEQVNERIRRMALEVVRRYQADGNRVLGDYRDTGQAPEAGIQLRSLLGQSAAPLAYMPELQDYLLEYPRIQPVAAESLFYWERVHFGMKPTLRLNHAIAYRSTGTREAAQIVIVKQLYASHYFQIALDVTACVTDSAGTGNGGFYLISLKGSSQQGLTGFVGSLLRRIIVSRARSAQERLLINIKQSLEDRHASTNVFDERHPSGPLLERPATAHGQVTTSRYKSGVAPLRAGPAYRRRTNRPNTDRGWRSSCGVHSAWKFATRNQAASARKAVIGRRPA